MELEKMSSAELISLVRRQEQELAAVRAALDLSHARQLELESPVAQQGGGELPQDERESFEAWGHTDPAAPWFVAPDPNERDGETYIRKTDAAAWAAWQARAALAQRAASVPAQAE